MTMHIGDSWGNQILLPKTFQDTTSWKNLKFLNSWLSLQTLHTRYIFWLFLSTLTLLIFILYFQSIQKIINPIPNLCQFPSKLCNQCVFRRSRYTINCRGNCLNDHDLTLTRILPQLELKKKLTEKQKFKFYWAIKDLLEIENFQTVVLKHLPFVKFGNLVCIFHNCLYRIPLLVSKT